MLEILTRAADRDGVFHRAVAIRPNNFDAASRTFTGAVLATSAPVSERGAPVSLNLAAATLPASLPLVLDHRNDVHSTVGRMNNLRVVGDELLGDGRISGDPNLNWLCERIADGTVDALSVAYRATRTSDGAGRRVVVPEFVHAAIVQNGADRRAGIRSADDDDDDARDRRIDSLCRMLELPPETRTRAIAEQWSDARIREQVQRRNADILTTRHNAESLDNPDAYRRAAIDSLVCRMTGAAPQGSARELAGLPWAEFHRRHLRQAGYSVAGLGDAEVITRALSTSDLPLLAGEAYNISVRRTYEAAASPSAALAGPRTLPDFRQHTEALADWTTLKVDKVGELGEFKSSFVSEDGETYALFTVGGITAISRQVYVNAGGRLGNLSTAHGQRLAADVADRRIAYLAQAALAGPTMRDGNSVFFAARGNIADLNITSIDTVIDSLLAARAAMAKRKGAGNVMIGQFPRYWMVPAEFEGTAVRTLATINATRPADVNPLTGRLEIIAEPRLTDIATSYLVCSPATLDGLVQVGLDGAPGPMTESRWAFEKDALEFKIRLDTANGFVEWRSWTRLDHAELSP